MTTDSTEQTIVHTQPTHLEAIQRPVLRVVMSVVMSMDTQTRQTFAVQGSFAIEVSSPIPLGRVDSA
jgi:hypothetical protein